MTTTTFSGRLQVLQLVEQTVGRYVTELQDGYLRDKSAAVAMLAQLRRGAGKLPEETPELCGTTRDEARRVMTEHAEYGGSADAAASRTASAPPKNSTPA